MDRLYHYDHQRPTLHNYYMENVNPQAYLLQSNQFEQPHIPDTQQRLLPLSPLNNPGIPDFVKKVFRMLQIKSYENIVCWGIRRDTFAVKDPEEFSRHVLAKHFKHNNFASFVRQLNKYDFHKVKTSSDEVKIYGERAWEFHHPKFQADRPDLLERIKRKAPSGRSKAASAVTARSPSLTASSTSSEPSHEDLHQLKGELQNQINMLAQTQGNMASYLQNLSKNCTIVVEELTKVRKSMVAQDNLMQNLASYMVHQASAGTEQKGTNISQVQMDGGQNSYERQMGRKDVLATPTAALQTIQEDVAMPFVHHSQAERLTNTYAVESNKAFDHHLRTFAVQATPNQMTNHLQDLNGSNLFDSF